MSLEKPSKLLRKKKKSLKIEVFKIFKVIKTLLSLMIIYLFILWSFLKRASMTTLIKTVPYPIFFYLWSTGWVLHTVREKIIPRFEIFPPGS